MEDTVAGKKKLHKTVSPHMAITPVHGPKEAGATPAIKDKNTMKKPRVYPKIDEKHAAFAALVRGGVDKVKAAEVLGYKPNKAYDLARRVEKKGHKLDVARESMVRLAHRAVKNCLRGQPWGQIDTIKDSTALAAAKVGGDRAQPKQRESSPLPFSYVHIDLSRYRDLPDGPTGGDIVPITPDEKSSGDE